jgi:hypothetical protein
MKARAGRRAGVLMAVALLSVSMAAETAPETFLATASVRHGSTRATAPVVVEVTRYSSADQRAAVIKSLRDGGTAAVRATLAAMPDAGSIRIGERQTPIKFASERPADSGRLVTVVTSDPILFLGAGIPAAKPVTGFDVAIAMLHVKEGDESMGELAPAAKVRLDEHDALVIEDYGATVVWLEKLTRAKR